MRFRQEESMSWGTVTETQGLFGICCLCSSFLFENLMILVVLVIFDLLAEGWFLFALVSFLVLFRRVVFVLVHLFAFYVLFVVVGVVVFSPFFSVSQNPCWCFPLASWRPRMFLPGTAPSSSKSLKIRERLLMCSSSAPHTPWCRRWSANHLSFRSVC